MIVAAPWADSVSNEDFPYLAADSFHAIPDIVRGLQSVFVAVFGVDGTLKDANHGFLSFITQNQVGPLTRDLRETFLSPTFESIITGTCNPFDGSLYRGLFSLCRGDGRTLSLRGSVCRHEGDFLLVAEQDASTVHVLQSKLRDLQQELQVHQRQASFLEADQVRLRGLLDATMRDREALLNALAPKRRASAK